MQPRSRSPRCEAGRREMHRRGALALATALAGAFTGCMVGPDYKRPEVVDAAGVPLRAERRGADRRHRVVEAFGDPVLDGLIAEALAQQQERPDRRRQRRAGCRRAHAPRARRSFRRSTTRPTPRGSASTSSPAPSSQGFGGNPQTTYQVLAGASWEIDLWGKIRRQTEAARANLLATDAGAPRRGAVAGRVGGVDLSAAAAASTSSS